MLATPGAGGVGEEVDIVVWQLLKMTSTPAAETDNKLMLER